MTSDEAPSNPTSCPSRRRAVCWSPLAPAWSSALLLAATFFAPLCLVPGCKNNPPTPFYPVAMATELDSFEHFLQMQMLTWPYLFGLVAGIGTLFIAVFRSPRHFRTLWFVYAAAIVLVSLALWQLVGDEVRKTEEPNPTDPWLSHLRVLVPTCAMLGVLVVTYFSCRTWLAAVLWVQGILAALSALWFLDILIEMRLTLLWGGWLSVVASLSLLAATWAEGRWRLATLGIERPRMSQSRSSLPSPIITQHQPSL